MVNLAVFVSGNGSNLQAILDAIVEKRITNTQVCLVISDQTKAYALQRARCHNIPCEIIPPKDTERMLQRLKQYQIHKIILAGYLPILSEKIIQAYPNQIINVHPSLLPAFGGKGYYGIRVHQAVLEHGVQITGATIHLVDAGVDTGKILYQQAVAVEPRDTPTTLQQRVLAVEHQLLVQAIQDF